MSLGRRKVGIDEQSRWVFNSMADIYGARPRYPAALIEAVAQLARPAGHEADKQPGAPAAIADGQAAYRGPRRRVVDLGAGTGHLALPLATRGLEVVAVEPAKRMLERLAATAYEAGLSVQTCNAAAEKIPLDSASADLVVIADTLHFLDAELTAREVCRILKCGGALAVITCELGVTPFMREVVRTIEAAVPRRPRAVARQLVQLESMTQISLATRSRYEDQTAVDSATLDKILRSISFIGPAMNSERLARFRTAVSALSDAPVWARAFDMRAGRLPMPRRLRTH